jgi:Zn-dependent peptidase ImmA (M78 family)/transcriptional regulator with XRE-family HTH domain
LARSATLKVDAALLKWARESAGLSPEAAAKKLGVKPEILSKWERTTAEPTVRQLEKLANAVKRPLSAFFLPAPPTEERLPDFRLPPREGGLVLTTPSLLAIRRARRLQEAYLSLATELGEQPARLQRMNRDSGPSDTAARFRHVVDISLQVQSGWNGPQEALKHWRGRLGELGVLVFQFAMPTDEISGFSLPGRIPSIVLNRRDSLARRCFTLMHEMAHILLGESGLCRVVEGYATENDPEVFCNAFAADFLVPMDAFRGSPAFTLFREGAARIEEAAAIGARHFSVSRVVILRRFLTAGAISPSTYQRVDKEWNAEPRRPAKKGKGSPPPYRVSVSELGTRFVASVLAARGREVIGDRDVADLLSLRLKHIDRVRELLAGA